MLQLHHFRCRPLKCHPQDLVFSLEELCHAQASKRDHRGFVDNFAKLGIYSPRPNPIKSALASFVVSAIHRISFAA